MWLGSTEALGYWCVTPGSASLTPLRKILFPDGPSRPDQPQLGSPTLSMAQDPISAPPVAAHPHWAGDRRCWSSAPLGWIDPCSPCPPLSPVSTAHPPAQGESSTWGVRDGSAPTGVFLAALTLLSLNLPYLGTVLVAPGGHPLPPCLASAS